MDPQWNLWLHLFRAEFFAKKAGERGARCAVPVGSCVLQVRFGRGDQYISAQLISSNSGWHVADFTSVMTTINYRGIPGGCSSLEGRTGRMAWWTMRSQSLDPLLDALWRLRQRGLTARMVAAAFHRWRVMPLTHRRLRLDQMTLEAPLEGSRMSHESLSLNEVARRARRMVGNFKPEDVDRVPMRPTQGFEPLVSVIVCVS
jgi:hypothetical protein